MPCEPCNRRSMNANSGRYSMECLECCAALVMSAHPSKAQAGAMLLAIDRHTGNPGRVNVLACVRRKLEKSP